MQIVPVVVYNKAISFHSFDRRGSEELIESCLQQIRSKREILVFDS